MRRVHLAPIGLAIILCAWAVTSGCDSSDTLLQPPPVVASGGTGQGGATATGQGGNTYAQGGQSTAQQGGASTGNGGSTGQGGAATGGSNTSSNTGGATSTTSNTGGAKTNTGGSATGNGGATGSGGTTTPATGGATVTGSGGATTTTATGVGGSTVAQTCTTDLMTLREGTTNDWIANTSGKSCGVQGSVFGFGDTTSWVKPTTPICSAGATGTCCISGTTITDSTYAAYGAGMGLDLNSSGGTTPTKGAYSGSAKGFKFTLTGTFPTGATMRIMYAPGATVPTQTDPYKEMPAAAGTYTVLFSEVTCPTWATTGCPAASTTPYQFKVQLNGGGATGVGAYNFCLTSIVPAT